MTMFKKPARTKGLKFSDLNGSLLIFYPKRVEQDIKTSVGVKDATVSDVHVLDGPQAGKVYRDTLVFPVQLQSELREEVGSGAPVLGRLGLGEVIKPGQSAPWTLFDYTDAEEKLADEYLDSRGIGAIGTAGLGENGDGTPPSDDEPPLDDEPAF